MKNTINPIIILIPFFVISQEIKFSDPDRQGVDNDRIERITELSKKYVDDKKVANVTTIINRNGKIIYYNSFGNRGFDDKGEVKKDDLYRIYSMTKPVVSVAIMQLYEKGLFHLNDPIDKFLPEFKNQNIALKKDSLVKAKNKITFKHLLTHTSGMSYGWSQHPADSYYRKADIWMSKSLDEFTKKIASLPLRFEPGTKYNYSVSTDILGALVEKISGLKLSEYLSKNIFKPLGMDDTFFEVPIEKYNRLLPNHRFNRMTKKIQTINDNNSYRIMDFDSGGAGLISTAMDYMLFAECLRNGGELNGKRIIGTKTIKYMVSNHLPTSVLGIGRGESPTDPAISAITFGLGFGILNNPSVSSVIGSKGSYSWGGAAGTIFWIDPVENIVVVSMIQLMSSPWTLRNDLRVATYQSLVDVYE
tara:strand:+ start:2359 stop:3612 length:1254 start_codon:yes stop_codon:yes gene_type:complete